MNTLIHYLTLITIFAPLLGCLVAGLLAKRIGKAGAHTTTIALMIASFIASLIIFVEVIFQGQTYSGVLYTWAVSGSFQFNIAFMIDQLSAVMMLVVTFVSLCVHIYTIGYMKGDPGYQRFFSYVSLFTFMMLMLVTANNFLQLYFGWEGVGLVSYLLIGFWFHKESAAAGSLKAFLANRFGDFGFILGIAAILDNFGTLDYSSVFSKAPDLANAMITILPGTQWHLLTVICLLLFIGAMGKSAQIPLHIWLPESMEGPTPISALIHAATMVTAGVFMVSRMSPLFEWSVPTLSTVMIIGSVGALFLGLLAFVEFDIKRVIAYSTMSQLGYMMAAVGASAYSAGIFHLMTHACFKALLFLSAGSVIIAMHHEQDLRRMGNLKKYLPVTYVCFLVGALSLAAIPPFAGFYSKDAIIEAVGYATIPGAHFAHVCLLLGSFVTAYYIFRAFFMAFHTTERMTGDVREHLKEYWSMLIPMIFLAIPSVIIGMLFMKGMITSPGYLGNSVMVLPALDTLKYVAADFNNPIQYIFHVFATLPIWFAFAGILMAWLNTVAMPYLPERLKQNFSILYKILIEKYGFDRFNDWFFVRGGQKLASFFFNVGDLKLLDHFIVDGSGRNVERASKWTKRLQTGYLYHYVFVMILGLLGFLVWMFFYK